MLGPLPPPVEAPVVTATSLRVLVAVFAGQSTKSLVSSNVQKLLNEFAENDGGAAGLIDVLLCLYDNSDWSDVPWTALPSTVTVRGVRQMKW
jgi:hypothetical protein